MKINRQFKYQKLIRTTNEETGVRYYLCPVTSQPLPSVTTILSATADKTWLKEWRARVGDKKANRIMEEASNLGTLVHTHVENHLLGAARPKGNALIRQQATRMADQIIENCLPHIDEVWGMEVSMYFPGTFAGTTDLVGVYKGRPAIMDHKTAKKMKKDEDIEDYKCQMCSYALAHNEVYGTDINQGAIFMVDRELKYHTFHIEGSEFMKYRDKFLYRLDEFLTREAVAVDFDDADIVEDISI
jgi:hypothetical protein